jgi:hypothetical protein
MLGEFIAAQHMFFNASAPDQGHIYVSREGLDIQHATQRQLSGPMHLIVLRTGRYAAKFNLQRGG